MKIYFIILLTLISINISFSQNLLMETDIQIQRFGTDVYYKDKNNNPLNGPFKIADAKGNYSDIIFKNGQKEGESSDYDSYGRLLNIGTYKNGKYVGTYTAFHHNGKKQIIGEFVDGKQDGKWETFNIKGKTTTIKYYKAGKKTGKWESFDKEGKLWKIENYLDDQRNGKWWKKNYYMQYNYYTYETEYYKNNEHYGKAEEKKEDGSLKWERKYSNHRTYTHKNYHDNGKLALVYSIKEGRDDGERNKYNTDGSPSKKQVFKEGNLISTETFEVASIPTTNKADRGTKSKASSITKKIGDFSYKALLISNQNYGKDVGKLNFPIADAENIRNVLLKHYKFEKEDIIHLKDATRSDIINTLDRLARKVTSRDNLLIFYAGHGVYDKNLNKGYWLPVDATAKTKNNWVSNSDIRDYITAFKSQHTLLITDACFSGSIFEYKQRKLSSEDVVVTEKLLSKRSRKAMTSGLNNTVPDKSVFLKYLIKNLEENKKPYLRAGELYNDIREAVMANTDNNPQYEVIKNSNHEGGEFIFLKKN